MCQVRQGIRTVRLSFSRLRCHYPQRKCKYDGVVYDFAPIVWKKDWDGLATFTIKIKNDDSLEDFSKMHTKPTRKHIPTRSVGLPYVKVNIKTKAKKIIIDIETQ